MKIDLLLMLKPNYHAHYELTPWPGYTTDTPGLAVCKVPEWGDGVCVMGKKWEVTHIKSGYRVDWCYPLSKTVAMRVAKALGEIADWTRDRNGVWEQISGKGREVEAIVKRAKENNHAV